MERRITLVEIVMILRIMMKMRTVGKKGRLCMDWIASSIISIHWL
jgi:hypothetical protein